MILSENIRHYFELNDQLYGSRRLSAELKSHGIQASHTTVATYMHEMGIKSIFYPKYRHTTDSKHNNDIADNLLDRNFKPLGPNMAWSLT